MHIERLHGPFSRLARSQAAIIAKRFEAHSGDTVLAQNSRACRQDTITALKTK